MSRVGIGDFMRGQKSPIFDGKGNVTGYDHGYGRREDFNKPIPRDEYKGPGHEMPTPPRGSKPDVKYPTPPRGSKPDVKYPTPPGRDIPKDDRVYIGGPSPIRGVPGHDYVNKPEYKDHRDRQPRREIVTKPTRDLNDDRVWSGGSRDFDERTGTNRPGHRGGGKKDWWKEPKRDYRPEKSSKERRLELLTGGGGRRSSDTDRYSLLTGRGLSSNEDRMAMLTGRSDPPKEEWKSQYGGRREYDPQDREFNRQFNTEPTNNRDVRSWFPDSEPSRPVSRPSSFPDDVGPGKKYPYGKPDPSHPPGVMYSKGPEPSPNTNRRGPIVNQSTVDLSGVEGRISQLEGKGSDWQEDRIKALEGKKPQDLSGIQGRLSELEGKGPSWQEDRVKQLEGSRSDSKTARNLLDQRIATLEDYYKNDPPPADSTGNRYEDKMAALAKGWDMTDKATKWDPEDTRLSGYRDDTGKAWSDNLQQGYVQEVRALNREYNKPVHTAQIKGREYKAYDPKSASRLRYLDKHNIHEDEYLGGGNWQNQYGEKVSGWGQGHEDRYFASQSGLDKDSDEYKDRFDHRWGVGKDYAWYQ
jgi:hypothetical protein